MIHFFKNLAIMGGLLLLITGTNEGHGEQPAALLQARRGGWERCRIGQT